MRLWVLWLGLASLLAGCRAIYVPPMLVGAFEGSLTSQSTGEVLKIRLDSTLTQKTETSYSFTGSAQFMGRAFQIDGTDQASGLLRYQTPSTNSFLTAFLIEGAKKTYCFTAHNYPMGKLAELNIQIYQVIQPDSQYCNGALFASGVLNKVP